MGASGWTASEDSERPNCSGLAQVNRQWSQRSGLVASTVCMERLSAANIGYAVVMNCLWNRAGAAATAATRGTGCLAIIIPVILFYELG